MGWAVEAVADYVENVRPRFGCGDHPALWVTERGGRVKPSEINARFVAYRDAPPMLLPTNAQAIMEKWAMKPLDFEPGTKWQYSNTNYVIAGVIVEKVSGMGLLDFLQQRVFGKLGMTSVAVLGTATAASAVTPAQTTITAVTFSGTSPSAKRMSPMKKLTVSLGLVNTIPCLSMISPMRLFSSMLLY